MQLKFPLFLSHPVGIFEAKITSVTRETKQSELCYLVSLDRVSLKSQSITTIKACQSSSQSITTMYPLVHEYESSTSLSKVHIICISKGIWDAKSTWVWVKYIPSRTQKYPIQDPHTQYFWSSIENFGHATENRNNIPRLGYFKNCEPIKMQNSTNEKEMKPQFKPKIWWKFLEKCLNTTWDMGPTIWILFKLCFHVWCVNNINCTKIWMQAYWIILLQHGH